MEITSKLLSWITNQMSISFYAAFFTKVLCKAFLYLHFCFLIFGLKNIGTKYAQKMLKRITNQVSISSLFYTAFFAWKCFTQLFSTYILVLYYFGEKILAQKLLMKCWWNWLQTNFFQAVITIITSTDTNTSMGTNMVTNTVIIGKDYILSYKHSSFKFKLEWY